MPGLSSQCALKQTSADQYEFVASRPGNSAIAVVPSRHEAAKRIGLSNETPSWPGSSGMTDLLEHPVP
jgi:hypothetical protein